MASPYRLTEFGHRLAAGAHVIKAADLEPLAEATRLVADAEREAERIREEARAAYREEKRRGYEEGLEEARVAAVGRLIAETRVLDEALAAAQHALTELVVHSVRKLIDGFSDVERAEAVVHGALKQMRKEKRIQLFVAPAHYAHFRDRIGAITASLPEIDLVDVIEDSGLEPPRVVVESSIGRVDGHFAERLADLEAVIRRVPAQAEDAAAEVTA